MAFKLLDDDQQTGFRLLDDDAKPMKLSGEGGFQDALRAEVKNADAGTRNIAGFGTALSNVWEGAKQFVGQGDRQRIEANKVIEQEAPVGAVLGNVAMTAIPFGLAGNTIGAAAKVGTVMGALNPVSGEQTAENITRGKILGAATGGTLAAGGQAIANKSGQMIADKMASLATRKAQNAPLEKTLNDALDAGLTVPPSSVNPSTWNTVRESVAGKIATAQEASNRNAPVFEGMARKALRIADDVPLTPEVAQQVRTQAFQRGYAPVEKAGVMETDGAYDGALRAITSTQTRAANSFPAAVKSEIQPFVDSMRVKQFDAGDAIAMTRQLRDMASQAYAKQDKDLGKAYRSVSKALEDQIERGLQRQGKDGAAMLAEFRDARKLMAKSHTIEDAIVKGGGTLDARVIGRRAQAGKPLEDELAVMGNFANNFKKASQPANQIAGPGVSKLDYAMSIFGGGAGAGLADEGNGAMGAGLGAMATVIGPRAMRAQLLSRHSQNSLRDLYRLGLAPRAANGLLQYAPVGGAVLGGNALSQ